MKNLGLLILALVLFGCEKQQDDAESETQLRYVRTLQINSSIQNLSRELPAVVAANRQAELSFRVPGKLIELKVREGDKVTEGQVLAVLDKTDTQIRLKSDQASYDKALADFKRGQLLVGNGTISQSDYNQLESALAGAEAALNTTKQNLIYTTLSAPFDGLIAKRNVDNYEEVQAKQPILVLQDVSTIDIKVDVPESIMILTEQKDRPDVVAIFDAIPNKTFPLTMKEVATQADRETNTYEVTLSMPTVKGYNILPGMSVTARATQKQGQGNTVSSNIFVPTHAVLEDAAGRYVFTAKPTEGDRAIVERRDVITGTLNSLGLEIVSGLKQDDLLVIAGMSKMFDGLEVRIKAE